MRELKRRANRGVSRRNGRRRVGGAIFFRGFVSRGERRVSPFDKRVVLIAPPILQTVLFAFALTQDVKNARLGIVDFDAALDRAKFSRRLASPGETAEVPLIFDGRRDVRREV